MMACQHTGVSHEYGASAAKCVEQEPSDLRKAETNAKHNCAFAHNRGLEEQLAGHVAVGKVAFFGKAPCESINPGEATACGAAAQAAI